MKRALSLMGMVFATVLAGTQAASATEYPLPPPDSRLIGENTTYTVPNDGRPLEAIAADYKIGLLGMLEANPGTDPFLPKPGSVLTIPTQMLLPDTKREGIIVNGRAAPLLLSERREQSDRLSDRYRPDRDAHAAGGDLRQPEDP